MMNSNNRTGRSLPINPATRIIVSVVCIWCGISGLEHGFFETLQGNAAPEGLLISAIGPAQRFWPGGTETAFTVIPNFLVTGILAMLASLAVIVWSGWFIASKHGAVVFLLLSILQFLVGGGFAQIFLVLLVSVAATQIHTRLAWFRPLFPALFWRFLGALWLWLLLLFAFSLSGMMVAAIFGYIPLLSNLFDLGADTLPGFLTTLGYSMLGLLPLTILAGLASDAERRLIVPFSVTGSL